MGKRILLLLEQVAQKNEMSDPDIYDLLYKLVHDEGCQIKLDVYSKSTWRMRAESRASDVVRLLPKSFQPNSLLDIGCSEGSITEQLCGQLGINAADAHGCDVQSMFNRQTRAGPSSNLTSGGDRFQFILLDSEDSCSLPLDNNSKSLVTCLMSLHHIRDADKMISEIFRVLQPGGVCVIREHDFPEDNQRADIKSGESRAEGFRHFLDVIHGLFSLVLSNPREVESSQSFCKEYFANYRSLRSWQLAMNNVGFVEELSTRRPIRGPNLLRQYWAVFKKPDDKPQKRPREVPMRLEERQVEAVRRKKRAEGFNLVGASTNKLRCQGPSAKRRRVDNLDIKAQGLYANADEERERKERRLKRFQ